MNGASDDEFESGARAGAAGAASHSPAAAVPAAVAASAPLRSRARLRAVLLLSGLLGSHGVLVVGSLERGAKVFVRE